jgi:hypothetical protein
MAEGDARLCQIHPSLTYLWSPAMAPWRSAWLRIPSQCDLLPVHELHKYFQTAKTDSCGMERHARKHAPRAGLRVCAGHTDKRREA